MAEPLSGSLEKQRNADACLRSYEYGYGWVELASGLMRALGSRNQRHTVPPPPTVSLHLRWDPAAVAAALRVYVITEARLNAVSPDFMQGRRGGHRVA